MDGLATLTLLSHGEDYVISMPYAHCKGKSANERHTIILLNLSQYLQPFPNPFPNPFPPPFSSPAEFPVIFICFFTSSGLLIGTLTMEYGGTVKIECEKTGYHTEIEFKLKVPYSLYLAPSPLSNKPPSQISSPF